MDERISFRSGNIIVEGVITKRNNFQLHIEMVKPYTNWKMRSAFTSPVPTGWRDFVETYRLRAHRMLNDAYHKLKKIDEEIDLIAKVYKEYQEEIESVSRIECTKTRERILYKLNRWFFYDFLEKLTERRIFLDDQERILHIIAAYHKEKQKIYLA